MRSLIREEVQASRACLARQQSPSPGPSRKRPMWEADPVSKASSIEESDFRDSDLEEEGEILADRQVPGRKFLFRLEDTDELVQAVRNTMQIEEVPKPQSRQDLMFGGLVGRRQTVFPETRVWEEVSKIDFPVATVTKKTAIPFEDSSSLRDPMDRKADVLLKRTWETSAALIRANIAATLVARSMFLTYRNWEKLLPHLLFAYWEVPQESTGFSPFELVYGRRVRGPLDLVLEHWEGEGLIEGVPIVPYVLELRDRLQELTQVVRENLQATQRCQRVWYDRRARECTLEIGQKVLVLEPTKQNKFQAAWQGPYQVVGKIADTTYNVSDCDDPRVIRMFHVNMLKPYRERPEEVVAICAPEAEYLAGLPLPDVLRERTQSKTWEQVHLGEDLGPRERQQAEALLRLRQRMFSERPGYTRLAQHKVETQDQTPLRQNPFRVPESVREGMRQEMLLLGVVDESDSLWASPVVLLPKKDGTTRFCVDYHKLNEKTVTDTYPMPRVDELLDQLAGAKYLTTIDLCKGYWQIPLSPDAIPKSAFVTPFGLFQFRVMPFGMKNAPATFQRLADRLLDGLQDYACAYLDIAIYSATWEEHLNHLETLLDRIHQAGITLNPNKCHVGKAEVQYLGHWVGSGKQRPEPAKIEAIAKWPVPCTKTQVMAFLGTVGYYRKFVPNYSSVAKPLTDLTRKNQPRQVTWTSECEEAFRQLKDALTNTPVLAAPDPTKCFLVHTDASMFGLGAVLSQFGPDGQEHPVAYLSRKLLPCEVSYAAIEECLAVVWALKKLQPYLYGQFSLLTDHNPLVWLNRVSGDNARLLRWSLALQPLDFTIHHRPGKQNGNADGLKSTNGTCTNPINFGHPQTDPLRIGLCMPIVSLKRGSRVTEPLSTQSMLCSYMYI
ncbi:uncharacterized protein [Dendrobates tinctorius]|uniref:uncharacterized protein n=1 Tax=Dendrobates tinctorius TaxID=92724 RepID=UPI003CC933F8